MSVPKSINKYHFKYFVLIKLDVFYRSILFNSGKMYVRLSVCEYQKFSLTTIPIWLSFTVKIPMFKKCFLSFKLFEVNQPDKNILENRAYIGLSYGRKLINEMICAFLL